MNPIRQFELIIEISRQGTITGAAENLHISQPTLSKYLANIEKQLGFELFDRTTLPIRLTAAGEKYISAGKRIVDVYSQLDNELNILRNNQFDEVRVGISPSRAPYILPEILKKFRATNGRTRVVVLERTMAQLNAELIRGEVNIIISLLTEQTKQFERIELFSEELCLAVPACMSGYTPVEILTQTPIISTGSYLRLGKLLADMFEYLKAPEPIIEVQSIKSALSLVKSGFGSMLVPSYIADYEKSIDIAFLPLPDEVKEKMTNELDRKVCVLFRKEQILTSAETNFISACR